jgi:orotate phosphoribosyltransferase
MPDVIAILKKTGALVPNSHFVGVSGLHFDTYINKDALYPHTEDTSAIAELFAEKYKDNNIEVVVGPALGGIILSQWVAHHLTILTGREVLGVYTEKAADGGQAFTRGYDKYVTRKQVLVVEDAVTTGGSVKKVVEAVKEVGGIIAGVCVMVNRSPDEVTPETLGFPFEALATYPVKTYEASECPLCKANVPINTNLGHGKKFLESQKN